MFLAPPPPPSKQLTKRLRPNPKKNMGVWEPMPELTITSPYIHSRVDSNTFTTGNPVPESTLVHSQVLWIWPLNNSVLAITRTSPMPTEKLERPRGSFKGWEDGLDNLYSCGHKQCRRALSRRDFRTHARLLTVHAAPSGTHAQKLTVRCCDQ